MSRVAGKAVRRTGIFVLAFSILAAGVGATRAETPRTVYFSATDASGAQVTDLTAADLAVKEDGKERAIASLKPATEKMDATILVDDNGNGAFQAGVMEFLQALMGRARFSITQFSPQAVKLMDYTEDFDPIQGALNKLGRRGQIRGDGEQLIEGVDSAVRNIQKAKQARPVMLVITFDGDSGARNPDLVQTQVRRSGVVMNVVHLPLTNIGLVLGDGPRESGGRIEKVGSVNAISPAIKKITDALLHQYALTYTLPDGVKMSDRVSISTTRKGITLQAPSRIPDR